MYYVGIDIGSTAAKTAVFHKDKFIYFFSQPTGWSSLETAESILERLKESGIGMENSFFTATGYGRISVPYADKIVTEISCHGKGADYLLKKDCTVIDIGGQDTKAIKLRNSTIENFTMNDKCSAGTGKFLEVMSNAMGISLDELTNLAVNGSGIKISSMCTVFAESEIISLIGTGTKREDIAFGIINSVIEKVVQLCVKQENNLYFLTGGLSENEYILKNLESSLGQKVETHKKARYAGAIGAALIGMGNKKKI
jgi:predicted CoA-substrate-specific enzyme activase